MDARAARLHSIRQALSDAREKNLAAVSDDHHPPAPAAVPATPAAAEVTSRALSSRTRKRRRAAEPNDVVSKDMACRAGRLHRFTASAAPPDGEAVPITYGGRGELKPGAADRVVDELRDVAERKARARKVVKDDDGEGDIGYINEDNRRFNKVVDRMYEKHEVVKEIKDNLERGTALP